MLKRLLPLILLLISSPTFSLDYKVLAVVNGESISSIQVRDRAKLVISSSGLPDTPETKAKVTKETMEILINEILQKQEAKAKGIEVTEEEYKTVIKELEQQNKLPENGFRNFIESKGISYDAAIEQVRSSVMWRKVMMRFIRPSITVSDSDIQKESAKYSAKDKVTTVNVSEIIIPIEFDNEDKAKETADTVVQKARGGDDFATLARMYSGGKTAKDGGLIGWVNEAGIIDPVGGLVKETKTGEISDPLNVQSMYLIIKVNERKVFDPASNKEMHKEKALVSKMEKAAEKYVKELRQKAYIERKYEPGELMKKVYN